MKKTKKIIKKTKESIILVGIIFLLTMLIIKSDDNMQKFKIQLRKDIFEVEYVKK